MPVTPPPITPVPTPAPQRGDRATFSDRVDAFVTWLENATGEFEAVAQNVYDNATIAEGSGDVATVGLGIITANPFLSNIDNAAAISAFWVVTPSTTGTFPPGGARDGMVINKLYGTRGFQFFQPAGADELWYRRRDGSAYQPWMAIDPRAFGIGGTATAPLMADINSTTVGAGLYSTDGTTTGTFPIGAAVGFLLHKIYGTSGFQMWQPAGTANLYYRRRSGGTYQAWVELASQASVDAKLPLSGGTMTGDLSLSYALPIMNITETDQTGAAGKWRHIFNNDAYSFQKNTAVAGDFSTSVTPIGISASGAVSLTTVSCSGLLSANAGLQINGAATLVLGGATATLANNGYFQIGGAGGLNIVADTNNLQARNNGAATTLNLNSLGGAVQAGAGGFTTTGAVVGGSLVTDGQVRARYTGGDDKIVLMEGSSTTRGYITAAAGHCFGAVNAAHTVQALLCDNSGNFTAAGNITANSDERLKTNWSELPEDFLERLADIVLLGRYDRIDTGETQIGMSAQGVYAFAPELVTVDPETGIMSLDYGKLGAVAAAFLARKNRQQKNELKELRAMVKTLIAKIGGV